MYSTHKIHYDSSDEKKDDYHPSRCVVQEDIDMFDLIIFGEKPSKKVNVDLIKFSFVII